MGKFAGLKAAMDRSGDNGTPQEGAPDLGKEVNMTIKTPKALRDYWVGKAKMEGTTLKAFIHEALEARFGLPGSQ